MITLPLTSDPCRTFTLVRGDARLRLTQQWNDRANVWTLSIDDEETGDNLVSAMPLLLGSDLLRSFCPRLGTMVVVDTAAEPGEGTDAGPDDLGARVQVVWLELGETV